MTRTNFNAAKVLLTVSCAVLFTAQPSGAADIYKKMANDIARYSAANKVKNIAVIGFTRKARTSREESEYVAEKLLTCLVKNGKVNLMERNQLDKVMDEQKLSLSGAADAADAIKPGQLHSVDAIVTGTVFGTRDHLKIIARIIDSVTGAVLHTLEAQTDRQWDMLDEARGFEFDVPDQAALVAMFGDEAQLPVFDDFRDAPGSFSGGFSGGFGKTECTVRWFRVAIMQNGAVEAKAKYWARQMRDPDFSAKDLKHNPGGEIKDPEVKRKFYELLDKFYKSSELPNMSAEEVSSVTDLANEETKIKNDCGMI
ncbi:MAG: hypothetical protein A3J79_13850 [Elusimicrobia bacterium RIFOXYB2_FULL_62_6]|nr:MAG: hypothetical protein A3J79_13850 [Elusimicrobia bacterium RIFOXYB2_FULL_62_6]